MNFAQQILNWEEKEKTVKQEGKNILLKSIEENKHHFFCFITFGHSQIVSHRDKPGIKNYTSTLTYHIIAIPEDFQKMTYSIKIDTRIEKKNLEAGNYRFSVYYASHITSNSCNLTDAFFIQNYDDLSEEQRKKLLDNMKAAYSKKFSSDDEYSSQSPHHVNFNSIIQYLKKDMSSQSLKDFVKELVKGVKPLVKEHLSKMLEKKERVLVPSRRYQEEYKEHFHTFTKEEQKQIIDSISEALLSSPAEALTLKPIKRGESNFWEELSNEAVEYFKNHEDRLKKNKKTRKSNL